MKQLLKFSGRFAVRCYDKNGKLKWQDSFTNAVVNEGLDYLLDVLFGATAKPSWYIGLIRDDNYTGLAAADTMASHAGWEEADEYSEASRPPITFGAASGQEIVNGTTVNFSINAVETMKGAFVTDDNTKGGAAGKLWCTALFAGGDQAVDNGDTIKVTYTISAAAA